MNLKPPKKIPEVGFYYHYKHDPQGEVNNYAYEVLSVGLHTEKEGEYFVNYRPLYKTEIFDNQKPNEAPFVFSRPLHMFMDTVQKDGKEIPRFSKITNPETISKLLEIKI